MEPLQVSYVGELPYLTVMFKVKLLNFVFKFLGVGCAKLVMKVVDLQPSLEELGRLW